MSRHSATYLLRHLGLPDAEIERLQRIVREDEWEGHWEDPLRALCCYVLRDYSPAVVDDEDPAVIEGRA